MVILVSCKLSFKQVWSYMLQHGLRTLIFTRTKQGKYRLFWSKVDDGLAVDALLHNSARTHSYSHDIVLFRSNCSLSFRNMCHLITVVEQWNVSISALVAGCFSVQLLFGGHGWFFNTVPFAVSTMRQRIPRWSPRCLLGTPLGPLWRRNYCRKINDWTPHKYCICTQHSESILALVYTI